MESRFLVPKKPHATFQALRLRVLRGGDPKASVVEASRAGVQLSPSADVVWAAVRPFRGYMERRVNCTQVAYQAVTRNLLALQR